MYSLASADSDEVSHPPHPHDDDDGDEEESFETAPPVRHLPTAPSASSSIAIRDDHSISRFRPTKSISARKLTDDDTDCGPTMPRSRFAAATTSKYARAMAPEPTGYASRLDYQEDSLEDPSYGLTSSLRKKHFMGLDNSDEDPENIYQEIPTAPEDSMVPEVAERASRMNFQHDNLQEPSYGPTSSLNKKHYMGDMGEDNRDEPDSIYQEIPTAPEASPSMAIRDDESIGRFAPAAAFNHHDQPGPALSAPATANSPGRRIIRRVRVVSPNVRQPAQQMQQYLLSPLAENQRYFHSDEPVGAAEPHAVGSGLHSLNTPALAQNEPLLNSPPVPAARSGGRVIRQVRVVAPTTTAQQQQQQTSLVDNPYYPNGEVHGSTDPAGSYDMDDMEAPTNPVTIVYSNDPDAKKNSEVRHPGGGKEEEEDDWGYDDPKGNYGTLQGCIRDRHLKHSVLYLSNIIFLCAWWHNLRTGDCDSGYSYSDDCPYFWVESPGLVMFVWMLLYIPYLLEFCYSSTCKYLKHINTTESILQYMQRLYATEPSISLTIECYHMETRVYTYTDSNGNLVTSTQTVPVVTYTESEDVDIVAWRDESIPLKESNVSEYKVTKVKLKKTFEGDANYNLQVMSLILRNRWRDVYYNLEVDYQIEDFHSRVLAFVNINEKPELLAFPWCLAAHLTLFLALPYRIWMSSITGKVKTTVHKSITTRLPGSDDEVVEQPAAPADPDEEDIEVHSQVASFVGYADDENNPSHRC